MAAGCRLRKLINKLVFPDAGYVFNNLPIYQKQLKLEEV